MPKLDITAKASALKRRIEQLKCGVEVDARDINLLLEIHHKDKFNQLWEHQKQLKNSTLPEELKSYEKLYKQSATLVGKCKQELESDNEQPQQKSLQIKAIETIKSAHECLLGLIESNSQLIEWLDRDVPSTISDEIVMRFATSNQNSNFVTNQIIELLHQLPVLVTSKSKERKVSQEQRFNWKSKREVWIEVCEEALAEYEGNTLEYLERQLLEKEIHAATLFSEEYIKAKDQYRDPIAAGNKILYQRGLKHYTLDKMSRRNAEVVAMEAELIKQFEAQMTDYEKEQQELLREHEESVVKNKKKRKR